ncbi:MAG: hypothetical protein HWE20_15370, partial [Gammaproteobacteria bacterium]|nr:hypothetical protein [Gammaproteobacteria bacterium]
MTSINSTDKVTRVSNQQAEQSSSTGELKRSATHKTDEAVSTALNRAAQSTRRAKDGLTNDADKFKVTGDDGKFLAKKGDDVAVVSGNNNLVRLQGGNDIAVLSANADGNRIHGGGGDDTLKIDGKLKDYVFTRAEGGWIEVKNTETGTVNLIRNMDYVVVGDGKPVKTKDLVQGGKPGNEKPENDKPGKPDKEDKPGKPDKEDKPGKPDKEDKPGKPDKEDKPGKPGKDKGPFTKEADEHVFSKGGEKANMRKGDDIAKVNSDDNLIRMNGGDDYTMVALGTSGNELHGGGGKDLIHFQGEREQYSIEKAEKNFYIITDLETGETNRFRNYEQIQFGNGKPMSVEDLDIDGGSGPNPPPKGPFDENDNDYDHVGDGAALDALEGDDYISVTGDNNQIQMNTGDDSNYVIAGSKDNTFDGSDGFDTIVFQGSVKDYTVEQLENGGYKITNNLDGSENYFINYEAVGFDDAEAVSPDQLIGGGGTDSPFTEGDDFLEGTADGETIDTLAGDDELWLSGDDNNVTMNDGDDVTGVYIGSDNNFFDGADGTDTIIFQGEREEYEFTLNEDGTYQVVHTPTGDTNLFVNYEQVSFGDSADTVAPGDLVTETPTGPTDGDDTLDIPTDSGEYDLLGGNDTANVSGDDNAVAMGSGDDMTNVQAGASGNAFDGGDGN